MKTANGYEPFSWGLNSGAFMNRSQKYHAQEKDDLQTLGEKKKKKLNKLHFLFIFFPKADKKISVVIQYG